MVTGVFTDTTPRTAEEAELARSAVALRSNPANGASYARRAETLFKVGRIKEAYAVLDQGEKAVGEEVPALLFILRSRTMLLNQEERYAEAEKVGNRAIAASDEYLAAQFKELVAKGLSPSGRGFAANRRRCDPAGSRLHGSEEVGRGDQALQLRAEVRASRGRHTLDAGWAYLEKGSETSATVDFKEALKVLPDDQRTLEGLKRLEAK